MTARRALWRLALWNVLGVAAGTLALILVSETWLRLTRPFMHSSASHLFVPGVGWLHQPGSTMRSTNGRDYWLVQRANRWGFLSRGPLPPERAAASCHVALIGDSFVEAVEVPIADKVQTRLETLARRGLPLLDVTVSAFGRGGTGQVNQLPFYDAYARRLLPKLVVLVFFYNDFRNNVIHQTTGRDPARRPWLSAVRDAGGVFKLLPPGADYPEGAIGLGFFEEPFTYLFRAAERRSWLVKWALLGDNPWHQRYKRKRQAKLEQLGWRLDDGTDAHAEFTGFALDEFKARAERDGAVLAVLATSYLGGAGAMHFERLRGVAEPRGIPIIDQHEYIVRRGGDPSAARWPNDLHWNQAGHRMAAEVLLEYLQRHQHICQADTAGAAAIAARP